MKSKKMIKLLGVLIMAMVLSVFGCFIGCQKTEETQSDKDIYLKVSDNQGNIFYLGKDTANREKDLVYEYKNDVLDFKTEAFYKNGAKYTPGADMNFGSKPIHLDKPGTYTTEQIYTLSNGSWLIFRLHITVNPLPDTRPVPRIEILPDEDCISYELNEKYVYKYDGKRHRPKLFKAYDPECDAVLITTWDVDGCARNVEIVEGNKDNKNFVDIGIYKFDLCVDGVDGIGGDYSWAPVFIRDIIIEIII